MQVLDCSTTCLAKGGMKILVAIVVYRKRMPLTVEGSMIVKV